MQEWFDLWIINAKIVLLKYILQLRKWKEVFAPRGPTEEWHPLFCEALMQEAGTGYYLNLLMSGTKEDQISFFREKRGEVIKLEKRLERSEPGGDQSLGD